jgi:hypothetical protein
MISSEIDQIMSSTDNMKDILEKTDLKKSRHKRKGTLNFHGIDKHIHHKSADHTNSHKKRKHCAKPMFFTEKTK